MWHQTVSCKAKLNYLSSILSRGVNLCKPTCDKILVANSRGLLRLPSLPSHCSCQLGAPLFVSKRKSKESKSFLLPNVVFTAKHAAVLHHLAVLRIYNVLNFPTTTALMYTLLCSFLVLYAVCVK